MIPFCSAKKDAALGTPGTYNKFHSITLAAVSAAEAVVEVHHSKHGNSPFGISNPR